MTDTVEQDITFYGTGETTLQFYFSPAKAKWDKPRLVASVWDQRRSGDARRLLSHMNIADHEARVFLNAIATHKESWISNGTYRLGYEVTEQGHLFSVWRRGRKRALRRFPVPWSPGVDWAAQLLLQRLDEHAKMAE